MINYIPMKASNITRQEVLDLYKAFQAVSHLKGVKFAYAVAQNLNILKREVEAISLASHPSNEFLEFDKKRAELAKSHAKKDEKGEPITIMVNGANEYDIVDAKVFEEQYEALKEENKAILDERTKQIEDLDNLLQEKVDVELYELKMSTVPEDVTGEMLAGILLAIVEDLEAGLAK